MVPHGCSRVVEMAIPGNLIDDVISDDELYNNDDDDEETPLTGQNEP